MSWSQYGVKRLRATGIPWDMSFGDFSYLFGMRHRIEGGREGRDRLRYHDLNVSDTSRVERHRAVSWKGKELDKASSYAWHTPKSAASLFPRVPGSQQTHKGDVLKLRLEEWSTNWTSSLMQRLSKFSNTGIPAIYLRHLASYFN